MSQWVQRASMPTPRHDLQAISVGPRIYAIAGAGDETVDVVEIYDPAEDRWEQGPPIQLMRGWFGAVLLDGFIYAVGGKRLRPDEEKEESGDIAHYEIRDSVERLELATGTWSFVAPLSAPRAGLVATVCGGKIYAIGGNAMDNETRSGGPHLDRVEVFDPQRGHWSPGAPLPFGLQGPSVATIDDRIYLTSGIGGPGKGPNNLSFVFDPRAGRWEEIAAIPTGRCDAGVVSVGRRIYTCGGWGGEPRHDRVEVYDVDADAWSSAASMPEKKAWMAAAAVGPRIFVMGGASMRAGGSGNIWLDSLHELV